MIARTRSKLGALFFYIRNISAARRISEIRRVMVGDFLFRGYSRADADAVAKIYEQLNDGAAFSMMHRMLFRFIGKRCLFVVEKKYCDGASEIVGINVYYLNKRDIQEHTVHEGFIGVIPEAGGLGIATKMRKMAIAHFKASGFSGISTRISLDNAASLKSAKNIGFQPVEKYVDRSTGEQRYYMICKF